MSVEQAPSSRVDLTASQTPVERNPAFSSPKVLVIGAGGCGINLVRHIKSRLNDDLVPFIYCDTSMANSRPGEHINVITGGSGSGGVRAANAAALQKEIATLDETALPHADIVITLHSLAGGK